MSIKIASQPGVFSRHVYASIAENGDLVLEGQDLGSNDYECEWNRRVPAEAIGELVEALGGQHGQDVIELLRARFARSTVDDLEAFFEASSVESHKGTIWLNPGDPE